MYELFTPIKYVISASWEASLVPVPKSVLNLGDEATAVATLAKLRGGGRLSMVQREQELSVSTRRSDGR